MSMFENWTDQMLADRLAEAEKHIKRADRTVEGRRGGGRAAGYWRGERRWIREERARRAAANTEEQA